MMTTLLHLLRWLRLPTRRLRPRPTPALAGVPPFAGVLADALAEARGAWAAEKEKLAALLSAQKAQLAALSAPPAPVPHGGLLPGPAERVYSPADGPLDLDPGIHRVRLAVGGEVRRVTLLVLALGRRGDRVTCQPVALTASCCARCAAMDAWERETS